MRFPLAICSLLSIFAEVNAGKDGTTFFVVGDYGDVTDMASADMLFDAIHQVVEKGAPGTIDAPEFFVACGDNIYPAIEDAPTQEEFNTMLSLFQRPSIASLPVYAVRGNHDTYFDWTLELKLSLQQSQWELPYFYYTRFIEAGDDGKQMGLLFVDSVLMLCSDYTSEQLLKTPLQHPDLVKLQQSICDDPTWVAWGNTQWDWIQRTLKEWDQNPNIIWRTAVQHYPIFPQHYPPSDFVAVVNSFLPMLMAHKFDLVLCGHEHLLGYTQIPYATYKPLADAAIFATDKQETCKDGVIEWYG